MWFRMWVACLPSFSSFWWEQFNLFEVLCSISFSKEAIEMFNEY